MRRCIMQCERYGFLTRSMRLKVLKMYFQVCSLFLKICICKDCLNRRLLPKIKIFKDKTFIFSESLCKLDLFSQFYENGCTTDWVSTDYQLKQILEYPSFSQPFGAIIISQVQVYRVRVVRHFAGLNTFFNPINIQGINSTYNNLKLGVCNRPIYKQGQDSIERTRKTK